MKVGLSRGNSRSFTPIFVVGLAVLLVGFRAHITEVGDIQRVSVFLFFLSYFGL